MIFIKDTPFFLFCQDISICICIYGFRVIKIQKTVAHGLLHQQNKTGRKLMNRNPLPFLFYLYRTHERAFWLPVFGNFLEIFKKTYSLTNRQFGCYSSVRTRSDNTPGCVTGNIVPRAFNQNMSAVRNSICNSFGMLSVNNRIFFAEYNRRLGNNACKLVRGYMRFIQHH